MSAAGAGPSAGGPAAAQEQVVLLDELGHSIGVAAKRSVHHQDTPLHLAFSCYVFNPDGALLVTQRAVGKPTWPGVWTNSFCGHPGPGEPITEAVRRRGEQELGISLPDVRIALGAFRYRAVMTDGVVENEMCPVFVATTPSTDVRPDPEEVEAYEWVPWPEFRASVLDGSRPVSPWCVEQVQALPDDPVREAGQRFDALPPAARP